ncbi:hypothetical protein QYE76_062836 [Lolium multiflorum]|uniref:Uncharacterized protein n=1 Tax=Lolium multiflorum TaxID=4521 RepID=A0AAD8W609_LOLMU|nr:hypothetical protein QYE76_062836 [Lolium multiflorum]
MPGGRGFLVVPFGGIVVDEKMRRRAVVEERRRRELELEDEGNGEIRRERMGICKQIGGNGGKIDRIWFSVADYAGPHGISFHPESPSAPRGTGDGVGSPDG